jgi:hypothetical protein
MSNISRYSLVGAIAGFVLYGFLYEVAISQASVDGALSGFRTTLLFGAFFLVTGIFYSLLLRNWKLSSLGILVPLLAAILHIYAFCAVADPDRVFYRSSSQVCGGSELYVYALLPVVGVWLIYTLILMLVRGLQTRGKNLL